ncbi:carbohydrate-binding protein [Actinidia rufa]|uniref:Carbohydrate-binding protein n=1 Tax=Actinidia rufa TaxID=165716 RepID=A0A7J0EHK3_9ERIC|nr:carbohydrate-binding protein [Actinidia rufa]
MDFSRRKKRWLIAFAIFCVSSYGAYKVYHSPSIARKRKRLFKLLGAMISMAEMVSNSGETIGVVSKDLKGFARNLVWGFYANGQSDEGSNGDERIRVANSSSFPEWVDVVSGGRCKVVIAECIQTFVSTVVAVYLDRTMDINFYDEMFSELTNPKHQAKVKNFLVSICNEAAKVKTSHQVLTTPNSDPDPSSSRRSIGDQIINSRSCIREEKITPNGIQNSGWVSIVSSTLAVPSNRRFVLDVIGRVAFETIRSLVEFFLWMVSDGLKRSVNVAHEGVVERGLEVIRYVGAKAYVIVTICLALYLHIMGVTEHVGVQERDTLPPIGKGKRSKSADVMASLEARLQRVELVIADNWDKVENLDQRIDGLEGGHEEFHSEMQGILNSLAESWKAQMDALKDSLQAELAAMKEEIKEVKGDWSLCKMAITQGTISSSHSPKDDEEEPHQEEAKVGSLRLLNAIKAKVGKTKAPRKGRMYMEAKIRSFNTSALIDTDSSHNFIEVKEAKRLGLQLKEEQGWIKAVNTEARPIYGVARDVRLYIGDWCGQVDFTVVPMNDYPIVLGMEFLDRVRAFPIPFAETMCIMGEGSACTVPLAREALLKSKTLSAMQLSKEETSAKIPAAILTKSRGASKLAKGRHADKAKAANKVKEWTGKNRQGNPNVGADPVHGFQCLMFGVLLLKNLDQKTASEIPSLINGLLHFPPKCMHLHTEVPAPSHRGALHPPLGCPTPSTGVRRKVRHFASYRGSISPPLCAQMERTPPLIKSRAKETRFGVAAPFAVQLLKIDLVSFL